VSGWWFDDDEPPEPDVLHLFTAAEAATVLGIPAATVRSWARRQRIVKYGLTEDGHPMYERGQLLRLAGKSTTAEV
jgi:hypothetical protein